MQFFFFFLVFPSTNSKSRRLQKPPVPMTSLRRKSS
ncbi:hypothetical protein BC936DRAFT_146250 [Jimgerdemannia flammicorona]|uniref:Uncharacterized protein n=1 Tax=Jimgerdemannia flammicorona TaxID=994334 RepID=A0A433D850_9FUNG|nr:hypothetical protein BC936DRAFT_146250 [Jimgerdemannia flammicorona]